MATLDIGTLLKYQGRLHVVVAVTPIGVTPPMVDLEDVESGRTRRVELADPNIETDPVERPHSSEDGPQDQVS